METYSTYINNVTPVPVTPTLMCIAIHRKERAYFPEYYFNGLQLEFSVNQMLDMD